MVGEPMKGQCSNCAFFEAVTGAHGMCLLEKAEATRQDNPAMDFSDCQACDHSELIDEGAGEPSLICRLFKCYACEAKFPCNSYKQQKGCRL